MTAILTMMMAVGAVLVTSPAIVSAAPSTGWRYVMVAFSNDSDRTMDVFTSPDGTNFTLLKRSAYTPPSGRVRDPSIVKASDGFYYISYTTGNPANIGFARSRDLLSLDPPTAYAAALPSG